MKYIKEYREGDRVSDVYLCKHKQSAVTKNGKQYENVILQDKTGTIDAKIWDPNSAGIDEFDALDYIGVYGDVTSFNGALQVNIKRVRKCQEGEYNPADYPEGHTEKKKGAPSRIPYLYKFNREKYDLLKKKGNGFRLEF